MAGLNLTINPTQMVTGAKQAETALETIVRRAREVQAALKSAATNAGQAVAGLGQKASAAARGIDLTGNRARAMGMQLSQVGQQTMATGNFMQALAIQLPDIGLGFGEIGMAAGLLSGVALPLLWSAFSDTGESAKEAEDALDALAQATDDFRQSADNSLQTTDQLVERYGRLAGVAKEAYAAMASADQVAAIAQMNATVEALTGTLLETQTIAVGRGTKKIDVLSDDFGLAADAAGRLKDALIDLSRARGVENQARAALDVVAALDAARDSAGALPQPLADAYGQLAAMAQMGADVVATTEDIEGGAFSIRDAANAAASAMANIGSAAAGAYGSVAALASKAWEAVQAGIAANAAYATSVGGGRGLGPQGPDVDPYGFRAQLARDAGKKKPSGGGRSGGGGSSGGGGAGRNIADEYKNLIEQLDPLVKAQNELAESQEVINAAQKAGVITATQAARANSLAADEFKETAARLKESSSVWDDFKDAGGSAIDGLIEGTMKLKDALKEMLKELVLAIAKKQLLAATGGSASSSLGGLIFNGLFGGFFDGGGTIGAGQVGIVGENGPEVVRGPANVTSRRDTARMLGAAQGVHVTVSVDDDGKIKALVQQSSARAAQAGASMAVQSIKSGWGSFNNQFGSDGVVT